MRLSDFIDSHIEEILLEWENFAATIEPPAITMDSMALRDHAQLMLEAISLDLRNPQSDSEQHEKSLGRGRLIGAESSAEAHASDRLAFGYTVEQLFSEYRALRASVLRLWARDKMAGGPTDSQDISRFNEAIDQAIAESVSRYAKLVSNSQNLFLAILGHDLRNPLTTTLMAAQFILETDDLNRHAVAARRIQNSATRMSKLVGDLIDYTRTNLGSQIPITTRLVDLAKVCGEVIAEHQMAHPGRTFELVSTGPSHGEWDEHRLAQVLSNLIGNAVQYGDESSPIILRTGGDASEITISVENKGEVIPIDKINSIFDPLVRLAGIKPDEHSTSLGIGLYIAQEIVRAHNGNITVSSSTGRGTIFAVSMPRISTSTAVE